MRMVSRLAPPLFRDAYHGLRSRWRRLRFRLTGRVPWSPGYAEHKRGFLESALDNKPLLNHFREGRPLPKGLGIGIDERCVELPWLFAHLPNDPMTALDAGSALNHPFLLQREPLRSKTLHILTLAPEGEAYWRDGISYTFGDLRSLPYRDALFDIVACISTLEHVGCDASFFTGDSRHAESQPDTSMAAVHELVRVLCPGGRLLLSVPFGKRMFVGHSRQFDHDLLTDVRSCFEQVGHCSVWFYRYSKEGWQISDEAACSSAIYELAPRGSLDHAAAARAVACVRLDKSR
jgi:SAM-dependent methyltransferase